MTQQVNAIQAQNDNNTINNEQNRFLACEEIVDELVEQGLPSSFVPENFISKISKNYGISFQEAKTCLKLAIKQLESSEQNGKIGQNSKEELYAQSGYFYPSGYSENSFMTKSKDGMDSLSSLGNYNRLMFGIR